MFRRRHPIPLWRWLHGLVWPRIGWRRAGSYVVKRLTRLPGSPHSIAAGFACGAAISFTPFVGGHILLGVLLSFLVRGNYLAAAVGTVVGNPLTFPFIWIATYKLGQFMLGGPLETRLLAHADAWTLAWLWDHYSRLIWPMTVGSIPAALATWFAFYFPLVRAVAVFQSARRRRRERRRARMRGLEIETG